MRIDKPLKLIGGDALASDHTIGHTLAFSLLLIAAGALVARRGEPRLLWLGFGSLAHLPVDPVIIYPGTLLWPLLGWEFGGSEGIPGLYLRVFDALLVAGGAVLLVRNEGLRDWAGRFARTGAVDLARETA